MVKDEQSIKKLNIIEGHIRRKVFADNFTSSSTGFYRIHQEKFIAEDAHYSLL